MTPVTLLTGFLGSGKTTLLSRLLRSPDFRDTAVIVNEFGAVSLDHDMMDTADETIVTLGNGCLCCQSSSDVARTLAELRRRRAAGEIAFRRVVIETSGLADPVPLLHALGSDGVVAMDFVLAGVVTTVDAVAGMATLDRYTEARRQVAMADVLLLTKLDLDGAMDAALREQLAGLNPSAIVMDAGAWRGAVAEGLLEATAQRPLPLALGARHSHRYSTISILRDRPLPALAVPLFLEGLAAHLGSRLLRLKGLISLTETPGRPMVIHAVQHMIHEPHWLPDWPSADHRSRIVLIGHDLPAEWPEHLLDAIEAETLSATAERADRMSLAL